MKTIGLDLGTGAIKGVCWDPVKGILKKISERVIFHNPAPGYVQIDPGTYKDQILRIISTLADAAGEEIYGMAFAAASGNTLLCDAAGNPETPIISWLDKRLTDFLPPEEWEVRKVTGWPAIRTFPLMHLEYFRRNEPELLKRSIVAMNNDFLTWHLCGNHVLDSSNAAPFYFWDQEKKTFPKWLSHYGLKEEQLPEILPPGTVAGTLKKEFCHGNLTENTKIVVGSFDHPSGARAVNILSPGNLLLSCGTSWVGFYPCQTRKDVPVKELCDTFQSESGGCWGAMFSLSAVGVELEEFICERYGKIPDRYEKFNEEALAEDTEARQKMYSIIHRFKERLDQHPGIEKIVICGGPSEGKAWLEFIREKLPQKLEVSPYHSYTGAVGAAMMAGGIVK